MLIVCTSFLIRVCWRDKESEPGLCTHTAEILTRTREGCWRSARRQTHFESGCHVFEPGLRFRSRHVRYPSRGEQPNSQAVEHAAWDYMGARRHLTMSTRVLCDHRGSTPACTGSG